MLNLKNMSSYSYTTTSISGVPASLRDKLLEVERGYSKGDDVVIDGDYLFDCSVDDIMFTSEERTFFKDIMLVYNGTETFILCP